jgi:4-hydroxyphenylacetate 3-monooxygenase
MSGTKSEDTIGAPGRPLTGRNISRVPTRPEVYIYERVENVTTHPAFRNTARSIARPYDALHDPKSRR